MLMVYQAMRHPCPANRLTSHGALRCCSSQLRRPVSSGGSPAAVAARLRPMRLCLRPEAAPELGFAPTGPRRRPLDGPELLDAPTGGGVTQMGDGGVGCVLSRSESPLPPESNPWRCRVASNGDATILRWSREDRIGKAQLMPSLPTSRRKESWRAEPPSPRHERTAAPTAADSASSANAKQPGARQFG